MDPLFLWSGGGGPFESSLSSSEVLSVRYRCFVLTNFFLPFICDDGVEFSSAIAAFIPYIQPGWLGPARG